MGENSALDAVDELAGLGTSSVDFVAGGDEDAKRVEGTEPDEERETERGGEADVVSFVPVATLLDPSMTPVLLAPLVGLTNPEVNASWRGEAREVG